MALIAYSSLRPCLSGVLGTRLDLIPFLAAFGYFDIDVYRILIFTQAYLDIILQ